jgi:hypothetical protein
MNSTNTINFFLVTFIISQLIACNKNSTVPPEETSHPIGKIVVYVQNNDPDHTPVPNQEIFINPLDQSKFTDSTGTCVFELKPELYVVEAHLCCRGMQTINYYDSVLVIENETKYLSLTACLECW